MGNAEIDRHILAACGSDWRKVARIVVKVSEELGLDNKPWGLDAVAKRIRVLMFKGNLEAVGNTWKWRRSEIRLSQGH